MLIIMLEYRYVDAHADVSKAYRNIDNIKGLQIIAFLSILQVFLKHKGIEVLILLKACRCF